MSGKCRVPQIIRTGEALFPSRAEFGSFAGLAPVVLADCRALVEVDAPQPCHRLLFRKERLESGDYAGPVLLSFGRAQRDHKDRDERERHFRYRCDAVPLVPVPPRAAGPGFSL